MKKSIFLLVLAVLITGCGTNPFEGLENKSSTEAVDFEISSDLDSGNYDAVLNNPDASALDYAAAAMGKAGFDVANVLNVLVDLDKASDKNDLGPLVDLPINTGALDELAAAKEKLEAEWDSENPDPDIAFQLVMLSFIDLATVIAQGVEDIGGSVEEGITTNDATTLGEDTTAIENIVDRIAADVADVATYLPAAGVATDLSNAFTDIISEPLGINYDGVGEVTSDDLSNYLTQELGQ